MNSRIAGAVVATLGVIALVVLGVVLWRSGQSGSIQTAAGQTGPPASQASPGQAAGGDGLRGTLT